MFGQTNIRPQLGSIKLPNYFSVTADMTSATWNTVAKHEIATVTGSVHMVVIPEITETLTDVADGASIQFGSEINTGGLIGSTQCAGAGGNTLQAGEIWVDTTPNDSVATRTQINALDFVVTNGYDIGYEITGAALTNGTIVFHVYWEEFGTPGGTVTAGAGGVL